MKMQKKFNCTIIALAMTMVLGVVDSHAVCVPCQDVVDDVLNRACDEFAASPPNSQNEMANTAVEIFNGILLDTELCDDEQAYRSSAAVCQENLLRQLGVSEATSASMPEPRPEPEPEIVWYWADAETGNERGTFTTNGELVDGNASSGSYEITDFTVTATTTSLPTTGSYAGGQWNAGTQAPVGFLWDGNAPTQFWRSGGHYTNGLNLYPSPLPGAGIANRIAMSIDFFVIDEYDGSMEVQQSATIVLSLEPLAEPWDPPAAAPEPEPEIVWYWADAETGN
ncbi:MAG: hypothetical protein ACKJSG_18840, partial [Lentisphaeria bacterium]